MIGAAGVSTCDSQGVAAVTNLMAILACSSFGYPRAKLGEFFAHVTRGALPQAALLTRTLATNSAVDVARLPGGGAEGCFRFARSAPNARLPLLARLAHAVKGALRSVILRRKIGFGVPDFADTALPRRAGVGIASAALTTNSVRLIAFPLPYRKGPFLFALLANAGLPLFAVFVQQRGPIYLFAAQMSQQERPTNADSALEGFRVEWTKQQEVLSTGDTRESNIRCKGVPAEADVQVGDNALYNGLPLGNVRRDCKGGSERKLRAPNSQLRVFLLAIQEPHSFAWRHRIHIGVWHPANVPCRGSLKLDVHDFGQSVPESHTFANYLLCR